MSRNSLKTGGVDRDRPKNGTPARPRLPIFFASQDPDPFFQEV